jgi:hypothetical protein
MSWDGDLAVADALFFMTVDPPLCVIPSEARDPGSALAIGPSLRSG